MLLLSLLPVVFNLIIIIRFPENIIFYWTLFSFEAYSSEGFLLLMYGIKKWLLIQ